MTPVAEPVNSASPVHKDTHTHTHSRFRVVTRCMHAPGAPAGNHATDSTRPSEPPLTCSARMRTRPPSAGPIRRSGRSRRARARNACAHPTRRTAGTRHPRNQPPACRPPVQRRGTTPVQQRMRDAHRENPRGPRTHSAAVGVSAASRLQRARAQRCNVARCIRAPVTPLRRRRCCCCARARAPRPPRNTRSAPSPPAAAPHATLDVSVPTAPGSS